MPHIYIMKHSVQNMAGWLMSMVIMFKTIVLSISA